MEEVKVNKIIEDYKSQLARQKRIDGNSEVYRAINYLLEKEPNNKGVVEAIAIVISEYIKISPNIVKGFKSVSSDALTVIDLTLVPDKVESALISRRKTVEARLAKIEEERQQKICNVLYNEELIIK